MKKTLMTLALAGGIGLLGAGCEEGVEYNSKKQVEQQPSPVKKYEFTEYGKINIESVLAYTGITQIKTVDLDSDGDQDIIVGNQLGDIYLLENKIPQKNK